MILSKPHKIAIFLVPKTGSYTLYRLCRNGHENLDICEHNHFNFDLFYNYYSYDIDEEDLKDYRCFAFYRNPLERAVSIYRHFKRKHWVPFLFYFYGKHANVSTLNRTPYEQLDGELKEKIERITIDDFYNSNYVYDAANLQPQTYWLNYSFMNLLNFHDYDNQVRWVLNELGITVDTIPVLNESIKNKETDNLKWSTIENILKIYQSDYDFLASRGIYF